MNLLADLTTRLFADKFQTTGPSLTFIRLCTSRHLRDIQQIAGITIIIYFFAIIFSFWEKEIDHQLLTISALTSTAAAVLSWTYQTGSRRVGSIDLFANEIAVICRVCLIVDFASHSVATAHRSPEDRAGSSGSHSEIGGSGVKFVSQEQYTPVYDKNVSDLEPFDVDVVTSVTRFYTYRKTMMDYLRLLSIGQEKENDNFRLQMIYMQYLMYESAREAITLLVEFEPNQADDIINILCSEFVLFSFLKERYKDDFRGARLNLRIKDYNQIMSDLSSKMNRNESSPKWEKAHATYPELRKRYRNMCTELNLSFMPDI